MRALAASVTIAALLLPPALAAAEVMQVKLLPNDSRAVFKTDVSLETVQGSALPAGLTGTLGLDPARPQEARRSVRLDMSQVRTGIEKRAADMLTPGFLDVAANDAHRDVTFEVRNVEVAGPLVSGKSVPARVAGVLTIRNRPVEVTADATVSHFRLTPAQVEGQKRFGLQCDNVQVRVRLETAFSKHGMQVPHLLFLKVSDEIQIEADLVFVKGQ